MKNKVLVKIFVPELNTSYDVFLPVNEIIWKIKKLILKCITELSDCNIQTDDCVLIDNATGKIYENNDVILNTEIRNATELVVFFNQS